MFFRMTLVIGRARLNAYLGSGVSTCFTVKKNVLTYYVSKRLRSIKENLSAYKKEEKPEQLHRLRVEIKKIKAALAFISAMHKKKYSVKLLKPLFHKAGEIRELFIHRSVLLDLRGFPAKYNALLKKEETALNRQFLEEIPAFRKCMKKFDKETQLPREMPDKKQVKKYFKMKIREAEKEIGDNDREAMHDFRKHIKEILYVNDVLPAKFKEEVGLEISFIESIQEKTGKWHDTWSTIEFLSLQKFSGAITTYIAELKKKEQQQFSALHQAASLSLLRAN